jgi:hypothetical protein
MPLTPDERRQLCGSVEPVWTVEQAASYCGLSIRAMERLDCPRVRLRGAIRYDPQTVVAWCRLQQTHQLPSAA